MIADIRWAWNVAGQINARFFVLPRGRQFISLLRAKRYWTR